MILIMLLASSFFWGMYRNHLYKKTQKYFLIHLPWMWFPIITLASYFTIGTNYIFYESTYGMQSSCVSLFGLFSFIAFGLDHAGYYIKN